jgi:hypothetical protein
VRHGVDEGIIRRCRGLIFSTGATDACSPRQVVVTLASRGHIDAVAALWKLTLPSAKTHSVSQHVSVPSRRLLGWGSNPDASKS